MDEPEKKYIHGYSPEEQQRLIAQNEVLAPYIYAAFDLSTCRHLVEVGCGVGAQMMVLLNRYPELYVTGVEVNARQAARARINLSNFPQFEGRWEIIEGDALTLHPRFSKPVDAVLLVWVLEHVPDPGQLLRQIRQWLPAQAPIYLTEVFHQSFHVWPVSQPVIAYWEDTLRCQRKLGGDPDAGLLLASRLQKAGFQDLKTAPHPFLLDASRAGERALLLQYWLDLMRSALHTTLEQGETTLERWQLAEAAMRELMADPEAVFYYSFIQASARA